MNSVRTVNTYDQREYFKVTKTLLQKPAVNYRTSTFYLPYTICKGIDCINSVHVLFIVATSTPLLKDLYEYVTPCYAAEWRVLGTLLGLTREELKIIQHDNHHKAVPCCNAVLEKWLEVDPFASWNKLLGVIQSDAMTLATNQVAMTYASDQVAERGDYK